MSPRSSASSVCTHCRQKSSTTVSTNSKSTVKRDRRQSIPAAIVLSAFHKLPSKEGLTSRKVINYLKKHYKVADDPARTGRAISKILRCAVEYGLLKRRSNRYFLPQPR